MTDEEFSEWVRIKNPPYHKTTPSFWQIVIIINVIAFALGLIVGRILIDLNR